MIFFHIITFCFVAMACVDKLFAFCEGVCENMTTALVGNERPLVSSSTQEETTTIALLHALSTFGTLRLETETYVLPVVWVRTDKDYAHSPSPLTVSVFKNSCYVSQISRILAVTKTGDLMTIVDARICIVSSTDGRVVRTFGKRFHQMNFCMDNTSRLWACYERTKEIWCISVEKGQLERVIPMADDTDSSAIAFMPDGRMVVAGYKSFYSGLAVYAPGSEQLDSVIVLDGVEARIRRLKVCQQTGEIYVLEDVTSCSGVSVFSSTGQFLRTIGATKDRKSFFGMSLTGNGHVLVCGSTAEYHHFISIWTCGGVFVCQWRLRFEPCDVAALPNGKVAVIFEDGDLEIFFL